MFCFQFPLLERGGGVKRVCVIHFFSPFSFFSFRELQSASAFICFCHSLSIYHSTPCRGAAAPERAIQIPLPGDGPEEQGTGAVARGEGRLGESNDERRSCCCCCSVDADVFGFLSGASPSVEAGRVQAGPALAGRAFAVDLDLDQAQRM